MSEVVCDTSGILAHIDQLGDYAVRGVSDVMQDYAELIAWEMERLAPRDTGALEGSIQVLKDRSGVNRRTSFTIQIDPNATHADGRSVATYGAIMEEMLTPHGSGGFHARAGTLAKGAQAGGKFFERAVERYEDSMVEAVQSKVRRLL